MSGPINVKDDVRFKSPFGDYTSNFTGRWAHLYDPKGHVYKGHFEKKYRPPVSKRKTPREPRRLLKDELTLESKIINDVIELSGKGKLNFDLTAYQMSEVPTHLRKVDNLPLTGPPERSLEVQRASFIRPLPVYEKLNIPSVHMRPYGFERAYSSEGLGNGTNNDLHFEMFMLNLGARVKEDKIHVLESKAKLKPVVQEPGKWIGSGRHDQPIVLTADEGYLTWVNPKGTVDMIIKSSNKDDEFRCLIRVQYNDVKVFHFLPVREEYKCIYDGERIVDSRRPLKDQTVQVRSMNGMVKLLLETIKGKEPEMFRVVFSKSRI